MTEAIGFFATAEPVSDFKRVRLETDRIDLRGERVRTVPSLDWLRILGWTHATYTMSAFQTGHGRPFTPIESFISVSQPLMRPTYTAQELVPLDEQIDIRTQLPQLLATTGFLHMHTQTGVSPTNPKDKTKYDPDGLTKGNWAAIETAHDGLLAEAQHHIAQRLLTSQLVSTLEKQLECRSNGLDM